MGTRVVIAADGPTYRAAFEAQQGSKFNAAWAKHCGKSGTVEELREED